MTDRGTLHVILNLSEQAVTAGPIATGQVLWQEGELTPDGLGAWFVRWMFCPSG